MKEFLIFKNQDKQAGSKQPDFNLSAKQGDKWVTIAVGWNRVSPKGTKMISCVLAKPFKDRPGYKIVEDTDDKTEPMPLKPHQEPTADEEFIAM